MHLLRTLALIPLAMLAACAGGIPNPPEMPPSIDPADLTNPELCAELVKAEAWLDWADAWGQLAGEDLRERLEGVEAYARLAEARNIVCQTTGGETVAPTAVAAEAADIEEAAAAADEAE